MSVATFALAIAGCGGGPPADLFVVTRSGDIPGARLTLRITDDGRASCNGGTLMAVSSEELIDARQARRELEGEEGETGPADEGLSLRPGPMAVFRYAVRTQDGTVSFSDSSAGQLPVFRDLAALTRRIAKGPCGLPR